MTGIQMLLKQIGLDPVKLQNIMDQFTEQFPRYLNAIGHKVESIDSRLTALEYKTTMLLVLMERIANELGIKPEDTHNDSLKPTALIDAPKPNGVGTGYTSDPRS